MKGLSEQVRAFILMTCSRVAEDRNTCDEQKLLAGEFPQETIELPAYRIDSQEVAELLLQIVEHGPDGERAALVEALKRSGGSRFVELARRELAGLAPAAQAAVREVLQVRRVVG